MKMTPRTLGDKHEWAIINNVDRYDCILISLIDGANILDENEKAVMSFKKNAIVTKQGDKITYNKSDLTSSTKSTQ